MSNPNQHLPSPNDSDGPAAGALDGAEAPVSAPTPLLFLKICAQWYAVRSENVREVGTKGAVTRVPTAPDYVLGVTLMRGRLVPVVALEGLIELPSAKETPQTLPRLVVVRHEDTEIALVADETRGVIEQDLGAVAERRNAGDKPPFIGPEFEWLGQTACLLDVPKLIEHATPGRRGPG